MATEERRSEAAGGEDVVYKTKIVEFLGRSTPIILQNDNGPCPLLAICNVLLLRNSLSLGTDALEVPLQRLLSLVAERLIDSNSNVQDKDDGYVSNQRQNIADAIDLLPCLATGIDVNVQFRKINDFEFTRECAIFDLLDIGMYHGWIVDPQDTDTAAAIGSKSYNTLVGELVAFETRKSEGVDKSIQEEDCVDFAAATTAALGVPSPSLSRGISFDDCPVPVPVEQLGGKGDREEVTELMRALSLSRAEMSSSVNKSVSSDVDCRNSSLSSEVITYTKTTGSGIYAESLVAQLRDESEKSHQSDLSEPQERNASSDCKDDGLYSKAFLTENDSISPSITAGNDIIQSVSEGSGELLISSDSMESLRTDMLTQDQAKPCQSTDGDGSNGCNTSKDQMISAGVDLSIIQPCTEDLSTSQIHHKPIDNLVDCDSVIFPGPASPCVNFHSSNGRKELPDISEVVTLSLEGSEPIYEGEERILDSGHPVYEDREPIYEGEMVLAEQADKMDEDACYVNSKHDIQQQWQLIKSFLENNASQLTIYGLFCLQEGLKERELCVFFRNNHFGTMFKFNGELYLLATDQGYINQPDLVWEKLNEVNGDTVFMTGNFTEFKAESQVNDSWNERSAMTSTADYLATLEGSSPPSSTLNSDLQLAIALQQQEFEQQPQRNQQQSQQQSFVSGRSRLVTGPQAPRNSNASQQKSDSKGKCVVM